MQRSLQKFNGINMLRQLASMDPAHLQYFMAYFAQGVGRVGKEYLKSAAMAVLHGDKSAMQLFYNLLPEFGSLPWMLKPVLVFMMERYCSSRARQRMLALAASLTAMTWFYLVYAGVGLPVIFLASTGLISLTSAVVDGLIDGLISAESTEETAAKLQYLCQSATSVGSLYVGLIAWGLGLSKEVSLCLTALAWAAIAPCSLLAPPSSQGKSGEAASTLSLAGLKDAMTHRAVLLVTFMAFAACFSPSTDTFLFRKHVLRLTDYQQPLVGVAGTIGWFCGASLYRMRLSKGCTSATALRRCLLIWPLASLPTLAFVTFAQPGSLALPFALFEGAASEFSKAMTFMPTTVLQQLHAPEGCEGTAFTLMQSGGTVGSVFARNLEWALFYWWGVDPTLGSEGFGNFHLVTASACAWRCCTALLVLTALVPRLEPKREQ
eukprot:TRINITY_DN39766_c0_g1_i1.p1 TRINITY_DN39766_c0_g1~~TRINITY_DN39766_c0_g1_i1.p1  ORF type:complete len:451 (+),score=90.72 TRINITY_DN39766_c0_g1_i1:49-1353(+)